MSKLSRRSFLSLSTLTGGAALLAACAPAGTATPAVAEPTAAPAAEATAEPAAEATAVPAVEEPAAPTAAPAEEVVTFRVATFDWYSGNPAAPWDVWMQEVAFPQFMSEHPNMKPLYEPLGSGWEDKILTQMAAGEAPDVIETWSPILETWNDKNQLLDLQPLVERDLPNANNMWIPDSWDQMLDPFTGRRMGLPLNYDVTSLFYNKTAFEEAGVPFPTVDWTFEDYEANAVATVLKDDGGNTTRWGGALRGGLWWGWVYHIYGFGGQVRDEETRLECLLGEPEALEGLEWLRRTMWDVNCFARSDQIAATGLPLQSFAGLPGGITCMAELSTEAVGGMEQYAKDFDWEWGQTHYPKGPAARSAQGLNDEYVLYAGVVERGTLEAAWTFMKFMQAEEWFQIEGVTKVSSRLPCLLSVVEQWTSILREIKPGLANVQIETIPEAVEMGYLRGSPVFRDQRAAQELIDPAIEAVLVTGEEPVSIFEDVAAQVTEQQKKLFAARE